MMKTDIFKRPFDLQIFADEGGSETENTTGENTEDQADTEQPEKGTKDEGKGEESEKKYTEEEFQKRVDQKFAEQYPGTVKAICEAWYDALDYIKTNPEDAYKILMKYTGDDSTDAVKGELAGVTFYDKAANEKYFDGQIQDVARMASDLWLDNKLIDTAVSPDDIINGSFVSGTD